MGLMIPARALVTLLALPAFAIAQSIQLQPDTGARHLVADAPVSVGHIIVLLKSPWNGSNIERTLSPDLLQTLGDTAGQKFVSASRHRSGGHALELETRA